MTDLLRKNMTSQKSTEFGRTQRPNEAWLELAVPETPLEPDLPIVDTHIHLWDHATGYKYFVQEYAKDLQSSGHNVEASIYVECGSMYRADGPKYLRSVGETEFAVGMAAMAASGRYTTSRVSAGIVGNADLLLGDQLSELLDAHIAAGNGRFRGIRQRAKWDADPAVKGAVSADRPGLYLEPAFQRGLSVVASKGLLFEASVYHPQIVDVTKLAQAVPEATIVLVHSGSPVGHSSYAGRSKEVREDWLRLMRDLAACPNVSVKLGGILMTLANFDFGVAPRPATSEELAVLWRPFIEPCFSLFGPERCMVASNFPVDKAGFGYGTVWNMFKRLSAGCSADEKRLIFSDTARRIYRV
jgi:L-fuconolactonase